MTFPYFKLQSLSQFSSIYQKTPISSKKLSPLSPLSRWGEPCLDTKINAIFALELVRLRSEKEQKGQNEKNTPPYGEEREGA